MKVLKFLKEKKAVVTFMLMALVVTISSGTAFASDPAYTPKSMLNDEVQSLIVNTGADLVKTVLALVAILLPVGLTLWGIGFAVKKGIGFLKKNANKSIG